MILRACALYPDLMNIYADRGNLLMLERRCAWRGIEWRLHESGLGEPLRDEHDLYYIGGGQDADQRRCAGDLLEHKADALHAAGARGAVVLAVCGGYQLLGHSYELGTETIPGIGLLDLHTVRADGPRLIGNVALETADGVIAGFENHGGRTHLGVGQEPFGRVLRGHGNDGHSGFEGARRANVIGTYVHGPLLPKNAWLCDWLTARALGVEPDSLAPLDDALEHATHAGALRAAGVRRSPVRTAKPLATGDLRGTRIDPPAAEPVVPSDSTPDWTSFAVLRRRAEIDAARRALIERGLVAPDLPLHPIQSPDPALRPDPIKCWDVERAVRAIEASVDRDEAILDMGSACCAILPALHRLGYRRLHGVDLDSRVLRMPFAGVIDYSTQDMTATSFDDASFSAITSISAIEHGLDGDALWREVARLLRPGGIFLFSTDYWPAKVDTSGMRLFEMSWTIFDVAGVTALLSAAAEHGLLPFGDPGPALLRTEETPVHFADRDYTFLFGALSRSG